MVENGKPTCFMCLPRNLSDECCDGETSFERYVLREISVRALDRMKTMGDTFDSTDSVFGNKKLCNDCSSNCTTSGLFGVFEELSLKDDNDEQNGRSDYGSDELNSPSSIGTQSGDEITLFISSDEEGFDVATKPDATKKEHPMLDFSLLGPFSLDSEFENCKPELRRASSLKTNKTPPSTPGRKKAVRFADAFGLDLESVKLCMNMDTPPKIPKSALADLHDGIEHEKTSEGYRIFHPQFPQPCVAGDFMQRILNNKICLENSMINDLTITGLVRVRSDVGFHKMVKARYTTNNWTTFTDIICSYVQGSFDGTTDKFSFTLVAPPDVVVDTKLQFALSYESEGKAYWDNNFGSNYVFECIARQLPALGGEQEWLHFC